MFQNIQGNYREIKRDTLYFGQESLITPINLSTISTPSLSDAPKAILFSKYQE
jgi:hypothetical protein